MKPTASQPLIYLFCGCLLTLWLVACTTAAPESTAAALPEAITETPTTTAATATETPTMCPFVWANGEHPLSYEEMTAKLADNCIQAQVEKLGLYGETSCEQFHAMSYDYTLTVYTADAEDTAALSTTIEQIDDLIGGAPNRGQAAVTFVDGQQACTWTWRGEWQQSCEPQAAAVVFELDLPAACTEE